MTLVLSKSEKKSIKKVMTCEMAKLASLLIEECEEIQKQKTIDEDTNFLTMDIKYYENIVYMCKYLYEPEWGSYNPKTFWRSDLNVRYYILEVLKDNLSKELMSKIEIHINRFNVK